MRFFLSFSAIILFMTSCAKPCHDYPIMGADEFVVDSYTIRQGKMAILELEGIPVPEFPPNAMDEYCDLIAEDDILNIVVFHPIRKDLMESIKFINDSLGGFRVSNGCVTVPDGTTVEVAGLTLEEAKEKLQKCYREQIQDVEVFIGYEDRLTRKVEITGMAATATIPVDGKIRLYEVLAKSHLPPGANLFMSYVIRDGCPLPIDLHQLINEGDMCQNIVMKGGDKIFIASPSDSTVMVMGEVGYPRAINLPYGYMSLREALVTAGGIPFTGDRSNIQVIRGNLQCPKIYVLSWEHIVHLPNDSLLLMPGDTIYISEKPITQWNRFIEQLLPTYYGLQAGYGAYRIVRD